MPTITIPAGTHRLVRPINLKWNWKSWDEIMRAAGAADYKASRDSEALVDGARGRVSGDH